LLNTIKYLLYLVDILIYILHFSGILNDLRRGSEAKLLSATVGTQHCHLWLCSNSPASLLLSYQLLQHIHFAWYVNFEFSNLITLKKSEYSEALLAMQPFNEQAAATFKISASNDWH
jgi:hypothetical protein